MMLKKTYQTVILLPYLISMVVVSYLVYAMLSSENGFVNLSILRPLGKQEISWYTESKYWPAILILIYIWKTFGYNCILYYATLVGIDRGYYEAAVIDGASRWQQIRHITLPELVPTIITLTLMSIGKIFYSDFGLFYQVPMDSGPLYDRHLRLPGTDPAEQRGYVLRRRFLSEHHRLCPGSARQLCGTADQQRKRPVLTKE